MLIIWLKYNDNYILHTFQIADLKVSIFVQGCQIADLNV